VDCKKNGSLKSEDKGNHDYSEHTLKPETQNLIRKLEGKKPLGRVKHRQKSIIIISLMPTGCENVD
jgi:hypothetical protein